MIVPDHSEQVRRRHQRGAGAMIIALVAIIITGIILGTLTSPDPEALETVMSTSTSTTSTTLAEIEPPIDLENFSVDQIFRGEPFQWEPTLDVVEGVPIALLTHDGRLYLFATRIPNFSSFESGGLRAWRSSDGLNWEWLGQVIDESHAIASISSTEQGLVALGNATDNTGFTVWLSEDGRTWKPEQIAVEEVNEMKTFYPQAIGGNDRVLVVSGDLQMDVYAFLEEKLGEIATYGWGTEILADEVVFILYGPLGYPLAEFTAEDLGISEEEQQMIVAANQPATETDADIWVKTDDDGWRRSFVPGAHWIDRFVTSPEGEIIAHGWGPNDASSWTTSNGSDWDEVPTPTHHYLGERWGAQLVAQDRTTGTSILVSPDGTNWQNIGPGEHFPTGIQWWIGAIAAGSGGIASTVHGWDEMAQADGPIMEPPSPSIANEDGALTIDLESAEYRLETEHGVHTWSSMAPTTDGIEVDLEAGTIRFSDPETDELLATFLLGDFIAAQDDFLHTEQVVTTGYEVFVFTSDGREWTIQSIQDLGSSRGLHLLAVTDSHVVTTSLGTEDFYNPSAPPGFQVWIAVIP